MSTVNPITGKTNPPGTYKCPVCGLWNPNHAPGCTWTGDPEYKPGDNADQAPKATPPTAPTGDNPMSVDDRIAAQQDTSKKITSNLPINPKEDGAWDRAQTTAATATLLRSQLGNYDPNAWDYNEGISQAYRDQQDRVAGLSNHDKQTAFARNQQNQMRAQQLGTLGMLADLASGRTSIARSQAEIERQGLANQLAGGVAAHAYNPAAMRGSQMAYSRGAGDIAAKSTIAAMQEKQAAIAALLSGQSGVRSQDTTVMAQEAGIQKMMQDYGLSKEQAMMAWQKMGLGEKLADMAMAQDWEKSNMALEQFAQNQGARISTGQMGSGGTDWGSVAGGALSAIGGLAALFSDRRTKVFSDAACKTALENGDMGLYRWLESQKDAKDAWPVVSQELFQPVPPVPPVPQSVRVRAPAAPDAPYSENSTPEMAGNPQWWLSNGGAGFPSEQAPEPQPAPLAQSIASGGECNHLCPAHCPQQGVYGHAKIDKTMAQHIGPLAQTLPAPTGSGVWGKGVLDQPTQVPAPDKAPVGADPGKYSGEFNRSGTAPISTSVPATVSQEKYAGPFDQEQPPQPTYQAKAPVGADPGKYSGEFTNRARIAGAARISTTPPATVSQEKYAGPFDQEQPPQPTYQAKAPVGADPGKYSGPVYAYSDEACKAFGDTYAAQITANNSPAVAAFLKTRKGQTRSGRTPLFTPEPSVEAGKYDPAPWENMGSWFGNANDTGPSEIVPADKPAGMGIEGGVETPPPPATWTEPATRTEVSPDTEWLENATKASVAPTMETAPEASGMSMAQAKGLQQGLAGIAGIIKGATNPRQPYKPWDSGAVRGGFTQNVAQHLAQSLFSDERSKKEQGHAPEDLREFLEKINAVQFRYKAPFDKLYGGDKRTGVIAQDVAKSKLGSEMVKRDPHTGYLMIDTTPSKFDPLVLASLAHLAHRIGKLEGK